MRSGVQLLVLPSELQSLLLGRAAIVLGDVLGAPPSWGDTLPMTTASAAAALVLLSNDMSAAGGECVGAMGFALAVSEWIVEMNGWGINMRGLVFRMTIVGVQIFC